MDKYKIKDLAERLQKEKTTELKNKMLFMWIKQEVISLQEYNELVKLILYGVGSSLPDLAECNQASLDYATKKDNPDFFLIKQTFKEGINWGLNYVTKKN